jgi:hypothetical protein
MLCRAPQNITRFSASGRLFPVNDLGHILYA